ncbi:hypothetical protein Cantr_05441 [Candida viswanathii]|uniref:Uncharacterized protein n=1 Tax=Candida viswanathii TaxID=5486 RepID=A0A367XUZ4_9ASCO|nr:hypothetical protein Cantr_05441 [Candida viswanathii]
MSRRDEEEEEKHISLDIKPHPLHSHSQQQQQQQQQQPPQPSTSSSQQTFEDATSSSQLKSSGSESTEFTSPSKSLKSFFFKNRLSSYSIDSITEQPELEGSSSQQQLHAEDIPPLSSAGADRNKKSSIGSAELTPTKSPRLMNFSLRPIFMRSRSSGVSDTTTGSNTHLPQQTQPQQPSHEVPIIMSQHRRTTIEDFADTDSETSEASEQYKTAEQHQHHNHTKEGGDANDEADDDERNDSINSLLQEYNYRQSGAGAHDGESKFVFKEEFDDTSIKTKSRPTSRIFSAEENEELKAEIMRHGSVRSSGSGTIKPAKGGINRSAAHQQYIDTHLAQQHLGETRKQIEVVDPTIPKEPSSATTVEEEGDRTDESATPSRSVPQQGEPEGEISDDSPTVLNRLSRTSNDSSSGASGIGGGTPIQYNENRNSAASSANSLRYKIYGEKVDPAKQQLSAAGKHISTSTTFAEAAAAAAAVAVGGGTASASPNPANRSSLRASIAFSDESEFEVKYPEPTITPSQTPRVNRDSDSPPFGGGGGGPPTNSTSNTTSSISYDVPTAIAGLLPRSSSGSSSLQSSGRRPPLSQQLTPTKQKQSRLQEEQYVEELDKSRTTGVGGDTTSTGMFNETMIKEMHHRSLAQSSMSSGELLQNLEHSYDYSKSQDNSGNSDDPARQQRNTTVQPGDESGSKRSSQSQQSPAVYQFNIRDLRVPPLQSPPLVQPSPYEPVVSPDSLEEDDIIRTSVPRSIEIPLSEHESPDARDVTLVGENMTAGLDSSSDLPVMLFKVQDRNSNQNQNQNQYIDDENSDHSLGTGVNTSGSTHVTGSSTSGPSSGPAGAAAAGAAAGAAAAAVASTAVNQETRSSGGSDSSIKNIINKHFKTIGDSVNPKSKPTLVVVGNPPNNTNNTQSNHRSPTTSQTNPNANQLHTFDEKELIQLPTPTGDIESQDSDLVEYPWLNWSFLMIIGILVPPVFFLVPIGVLDGSFTGLRYADKKYRQFNKKQKIWSFVLGIFWVLVVLAMIGVGLGVGITKESS